MYTVFYLLIFLMFYLFLREERDRVWAVEAAERGRQDLKQAPGSDLSAEPNAGLKLRDREIMTWAEVGCLPNWTTQVPLHSFLNQGIRFSSFYTQKCINICYLKTTKSVYKLPQSTENRTLVWREETYMTTNEQTQSLPLNIPEYQVMSDN